MFQVARQAQRGDLFRGDLFRSHFSSSNWYGYWPSYRWFLVEATGYVPLFIVSSFLGIMSLLCGSLAWEPYPIADKNQAEINTDSRELELQKFWQILSSRRVLVPTLVMLMVGIMFGTIITFLPLFIQESKITINSGLFYTVTAIASFTIRILTGRASDRFGRGIFISLGLVCYLVCMLTLWMTNSSNTILIAAIFEGCGAGLVIPMVIALTTDRCPLNQRGKFFSLCIGGFDLWMAIARPCLGLMAEKLSYRGMFALDAFLACLAITTFITVSNKDLPHSIRFAFGLGQDTYSINI